VSARAEGGCPQNARSMQSAAVVRPDGMNSLRIRWGRATRKMRWRSPWRRHLKVILLSSSHL